MRIPLQHRTRLAASVALAVAFVVTASGCSRSPLLASGPIDVKASPTLVRFEHPVTSSGPMWETCFEFDLPGDSHEADRIHAVLLTTSGQRRALVDARLDRRGESHVCQLGRLAAIPPNGSLEPQQSVAYEAIELSADVPLRLRGIRGGSRPG